MTRPSLNQIQSGIANWDASVNQNFNALGSAPLPIYFAADPTDLAASHDPALYEHCLAFVVDSTGAGGPPALFASNGTSWLLGPSFV